MKLKNLFAKRVRLADGSTLAVSRHYVESTFGVRTRNNAVTRAGSFVCTGTPGTGFFSHPSDSQSYKQFVKETRAKYKSSIVNRCKRTEPSYKREIRRIEKAVNKENDAEKKTFLDNYLNCLYIGEEAEKYERITQGLKEVMHGKNRDKRRSILSHYKSQLSSLMRNIEVSQPKITDHLDEAGLQAWQKVTEDFAHIIECRRLWWVQEAKDGTFTYPQVFADFGVFCFYSSPFDTPLFRDPQGNCYYLYPDCLIKAKSTADFTIYKMQNLHFNYGTIDTNTLVDTSEHRRSGRRGSALNAASTLFGFSHGRQLGMLQIPELNFTMYCNHKEHVEQFVQDLNLFLQR